MKKNFYWGAGNLESWNQKIKTFLKKGLSREEAIFELAKQLIPMGIEYGKKGMLFKKCPKCKEAVNAAAIRCKHCHAEIGTAKKKSLWSGQNTFRLGFLSGILFALIVVLLIYWQVSLG